MCLSREEEKEHEPKWEKANLDRTRKDEIIMKSLGEEEVWENEGIVSDWSECRCVCDGAAGVKVKAWELGAGASPGTSSGCEGTCLSLEPKPWGGQLWDLEHPSELCVTVCPGNWRMAVPCGSLCVSTAWDSCSVRVEPCAWKASSYKRSETLSSFRWTTAQQLELQERKGGEKEKDAPGMANSPSSAKKESCGESSGLCLPSCVPGPSLPHSSLFPRAAGFF